jgi:peptidoglycan/LPS O-acetylase OafA/YrhL
MQQKRIEILDSFRFLAIVSVMLYHYAYRWGPPMWPVSLYPYGTFYGSCFRFGMGGVYFFFIISGFVISYTLENTSGFGTFIKNRFIRLFPPMLLWSVITFLLMTLLDTQKIFPSSHQIRNFFPSLTFTNPHIWDVLTGKEFNWINGSYWTLWVEVQFYIFAAIVFFRNREKFLPNLLIATIVLCFCSYVPELAFRYASSLHLPGSVRSFLSEYLFVRDLFTITRHVCLFTIGAVFHYLFKGGKIKLISTLSLCIGFVVVYELFAFENNPARILYLFMLLIFLCMIYKRSLLSFLDNRLFQRIGVISYSLYLMHENIGVLLINKYGVWFGKWSPFALPVVIVLMTLTAEISYRFFEVRIGRWLKGQLGKSNASTSRQNNRLPGSGRSVPDPTPSTGNSAHWANSDNAASPDRTPTGNHPSFRP